MQNEKNEKNDSIMADHGIYISDHLENIEASVIYQLFLNALRHQ